MLEPAPLGSRERPSLGTVLHGDVGVLQRSADVTGIPPHAPPQQDAGGVRRPWLGKVDGTAWQTVLASQSKDQPQRRDLSAGLPTFPISAEVMAQAPSQQRTPNDRDDVTHSATSTAQQDNKRSVGSDTKTNTEEAQGDSVMLGYGASSRRPRSVAGMAKSLPTRRRRAPQLGGSLRCVWEMR